MKLLVTGGCGFIGTNFILRILSSDQNAEIFNLDKLTYCGNRQNLLHLEGDSGNGRYHFIHGDITDPKLVKEIFAAHKFDIVVNFAAESHVDRSIDEPAPFITTNVLGVQNLLWAAKERKVPLFVHISTDEVYGSLEADDPAFTEEHPLAPNSPYSASKASADLLARSFWKTYRYPVIVTRCSNNYGPYQFPEKLIPLILSLASEDKPIPVYGDGLQVRDWIYVEDHCRGIELVMHNGRPGAVYNFGGDAEMANIDVVRAVLELLGKSETLIRYVEDRPGHDRRYAMNFDLSREELGFEPEYGFKQGLADTVDWYRNNTNWLETIRSGEYLRFMDKWYSVR